MGLCLGPYGSPLGGIGGMGGARGCVVAESTCFGGDWSGLASIRNKRTSSLSGFISMTLLDGGGGERVYQANGSNAKPMAPTCTESSEHAEPHE